MHDGAVGCSLWDGPTQMVSCLVARRLPLLLKAALAQMVAGVGNRYHLCKRFSAVRKPCGDEGSEATVGVVLGTAN